MTFQLLDAVELLEPYYSTDEYDDDVEAGEIGTIVDVINPVIAPLFNQILYRLKAAVGTHGKYGFQNAGCVQTSEWCSWNGLRRGV